MNEESILIEEYLSAYKNLEDAEEKLNAHFENKLSFLLDSKNPTPEDVEKANYLLRQMPESLVKDMIKVKINRIKRKLELL